MNEDKIKELLENADRVAGPPSYGPVSAAGIRRRVRRRQMWRMALPLSAAAVLLAGVAISNIGNRTAQPPGPGSEKRIASLEEQVRQLQAQTDAALTLVRDVLAQERQQQRLDALESELASIRDPREEMRDQADKAALALVYQADRFDRELKQTQSAIETYEQVIRVFPQSRWAEEAKARLAKIKTNQAGRI